MPFAPALLRWRSGAQVRGRALAACVAALLTGAAAMPQDPGGARPAPDALEVEYAAQPLGLDEAAPRLAWHSPVARQTAYRIRVAASSEALEGGPLVWDSGRVASDASVQIAYAGPPLRSRGRYWWQVQVWDAEGRPSGWSAPSEWEMALLSPDDWQAQWISGPDLRVHDWGDLTLGVDFTLTGTSLDILFRAQPSGKKYGDAYVWTLRETDAGGAELVQTMRRYPGGTSSAVRTTELETVPLDGITLRGMRHRLELRAAGSHIETRIDGKLVAALDDAGHSYGTIGFASREPDAAVIHSVSVSGTGSDAFEARFADNDNPFTGGDVTDAGLRIAAGVPSVDIVLPMEAPAPLVRRAFTLPRKPIAHARLYHADAGMPRILVNGAVVGASAMRGGYTAYDRRVLAYADDVTALLRPGRNVIGAELGRGWYGISDPNEWYFHKAPWHAEPALRAQLEVTFEDGTRQVIATDGAWETLSGPTRDDSVHRGERYDARLAPEGWAEPGFQARGWQAARTVTGPAGTIDFANIEPVAPVADLSPVAITEPEPGVFVFDFGRIVAGWPELAVAGPRGRTVSLVASEKLDAAGRAVPVTGLVDAQLQTDRYTLSGDGNEHWAPRFGYRGFRYVEMRGFPGTPTETALTAHVAHSAVADTGTFISANPLLNAIDAAARATILNNMHGFQTDTPTFEKNGWTGDAQASAGAAVRSLDVARVWSKWLADFRDAQAESGEVPEIVPATPYYGYEDTPGWNFIWGPTTPWDAAALILPWELYRTYGDTRILAENHAMQRRLVDYTARKFGPEFRHQGLGLSEWMPPGSPDFLNARGGGIDAVTTAYFFLEADLLAKSSAAIGESADAERYARLAADIREAYNARYWDAEHGWYRTVADSGEAGAPTQIQNALPLAFGMAPDGREEGVAEWLARDVTENGMRTGVFATPRLLDLLSDHGHADVAYALVTRTEEPSWGWWIVNGHSTMFESWSLDSRSRDHHYFGSVADWFRTRLAGLRPGAPGYRQVLVRPEIPAGLASAEATLDTVYGRAGSAWRAADGALTLTATVPPNTTGEIWVPLRFGPVRATPADARLLRSAARFAIYAVGPGTHEFHAGET